MAYPLNGKVSIQKGSKTLIDWTKNPIIHIESSSTETPSLCIPAILGGKVGGNWWVLSLMFSGAHVAWLTDHTWHNLDACRTSMETGMVETETDGDHYILYRRGARYA